jgi:Universal stress protein UspA and related nucleotide-binding proteins
MYTRILIATDGSELAQKGLDHGLALAKRLDADVTIVTVTEPSLPPASPTTAAWAPGFDLTELDNAKTRSAQEILENATKQAQAAGVRASTVHVPNRYPAEGIMEAAKERGSNLIVVASHGRRGLGRLLLGSQTLEVLTHSSIPVLVIR